MRVSFGSRWLLLPLIVATLQASAPTPRWCSIPWSEVTLAMLVQCGGPIFPVDVPAAPAACAMPARAQRDGACPMAAASCAEACPAAACSQSCDAKPAPPARCMAGPTIRWLWLPRAPVARYPGTAVLISIPAVEPVHRLAAIVRTASLVWPAAREPAAPPPVRGPPRFV